MSTRLLTPLPMFDPTQGERVLTPERAEAGYWVGCPGVLHEPHRNRFLLTYRQRRPRGHDQERGWRCAVAVSSDGVNFTDLWAVEKRELDTPSMERFCLLPTSDGRYQLYLSYVDPADNRWRIDVLEADEPENFDINKTTPVLTAQTTGTEGVKDPYVMRVGPVTYLFASYAAAGSDVDTSAHATADIYNVGATTHPTGVATSVDGVNFTWHAEALAVGEGWDKYQARLNSVVPIAGGYVGFYDGSASHTENYEERCGIAVSADLRNWSSLSVDGSWATARYLDAFIFDGQWWLYYELTRADGAHELRLARVPVA